MNSTHDIKVLHVFNDPKFSKPLIEFLVQNDISLKGHMVFHYRWDDSHQMPHPIALYGTNSFVSPIATLALLRYLRRAENIFIHGLASPGLLLWISQFKALGKRSCWFIWGKDLYFFRMLKKVGIHHRFYEYFRRKAIGNIHRVVTFNTGDYELLQQWYGYQGGNTQCFSYPSNLYKPMRFAANETDTVNILVGNSADPSNNYAQAFKLLAPTANTDQQAPGKIDFRVFSFLSYGDPDYAREVLALGTSCFGSRFQAYTELLSLEEYEKLMAQIDIGVFAHERQQAFGAIVTLLGHGKKIHISRHITTWTLLKDLGFVVYDLESIPYQKIETQVAEQNIARAKEVFSSQRLARDWTTLLSGDTNETTS